jgi:hypothetical protein
MRYRPNIPPEFKFRAEPSIHPGSYSGITRLNAF